MAVLISAVLISAVVISAVLISAVLISAVLISAVLMSAVLISAVLMSDVLISDVLISAVLILINTASPDVVAIARALSVLLGLVTAGAFDRITAAIGGFVAVGTRVFSRWKIPAFTLNWMTAHVGRDFMAVRARVTPWSVPTGITLTWMAAAISALDVANWTGLMLWGEISVLAFNRNAATFVREGVAVRALRVHCG